jgi:hypothetical protein
MHIRAAAELIRQSGDHVKGRLYGYDHHGKELYCINGALNMATHGNHEFRWFQGGTIGDDVKGDMAFLSEVILEQFPERMQVACAYSFTPDYVTSRFNNNRETTTDDILLVMDKAAVLAGE